MNSSGTEVVTIRGIAKGVPLAISQKYFAKEVGKKFRVTSVHNVPLGVSVKAAVNTIVHTMFTTASSYKILVRMTRLKTDRFVNSLVV